MGLYEKQIKTLKRALELEPESVSIMQLLAESYIHEGMKGEAEKTFKQILKIDPKNLRAKQALTTQTTLKNMK
jgi:tetratricopeptide (TPR) repeat protein